MIHFATERGFVAEQYSDADKLRIRTETHQRYSEGTETFVDDVLTPSDSSPDSRCWMSAAVMATGTPASWSTGARRQPRSDGRHAARSTYR